MFTAYFQEQGFTKQLDQALGADIRRTKGHDITLSAGPSFSSYFRDTVMTVRP